MLRAANNSLFTLRHILVTAIVVMLLLILIHSQQQRQSITPKSAILSVQNILEVKSFLLLVPEAQVVVSGDEVDAYLVQVFETRDGHTATFNWYRVNKSSGVVTKEF